MNQVYVSKMKKNSSLYRRDAFLGYIKKKEYQVSCDVSSNTTVECKRDRSGFSQERDHFTLRSSG